MSQDNLPADESTWTDEFGRLCSKAVEGVYAAPYWCIGTKARGTVAASSADAAKALFKKLTGEEAIHGGRLPYGAMPALNVVHYPSGHRNTDGFFCSSPETCMGHTSCPGRRACSE